MLTPISSNHACLYLLECISHGDSKYVNEIQNILNKNVFFCVDYFELSFAHACHTVSVKDTIRYVKMPYSNNTCY